MAQLSSSAAAPEHTFVVLGAGFAGVPLAHHLLKHTPAGVVNLRVVLVAPNDALYWNPAAPRGFLPTNDADSNPKGTPGYGDDKLFYPLAPTFAKYKTRFEQLVGRATRLDPDRQTIDVALLASPDKPQTIRYDTVLIATGSDISNGVPFKVVPHGGTAETQAALAEYRAKIRTASRVVVAGGGMTGVELAGELGHAYGSKTAYAKEKKDIVFIINEPAPLGVYGVKDSVGQTATSALTKLGVRVVAGTRVAAAKPADGEGSQTILSLVAGGADKKATTLTTDVYIPAFGVTFNSQFLPEKLLDTSAAGRRRVRTRPTFQAEGYDSVFVVGDAANLQPPSIKNADEQLQVLAGQLQTYLANWAAAARGGGKAGPAPQPLKEYTGDQSLVVAVSLGPGGGTGQMGTWKLWSFIIWYFKARQLGTDYGADYAAGRRTMSNQKW